MFSILFREGDWDGLRRELSEKGGEGRKTREYNINVCSDIGRKIKDVTGYLLIRGLHSREEVLEARKG